MKLLSGILATGVALGTLAAATQANAADIYAPGPVVGYKDVAPLPPLWTGFYIGGSIGGAWGNIEDKVNYITGYQGNYAYYCADGLAGCKNSDSASGVLGGAQVGYNWQYGAFVFGAELDFDGIGLNGSLGNTYLANDWRTNNNGAFLFDATGRLGYAVGPALLYVKGGYAYIDSGLGLNGNYWASSTGYYAPANTNGLSGWTLGGGIEYLLSPSWSIKAEYLHYDFGSVNERLYWGYATGTGNTSVWHPGWDNLERTLGIDTFKVGFNYHFNNVYAPLK